MTVAPHSFDADEFHDSAEPHASAEPASPAAVLKDIRFSYDRGTSWALDGVSLTVSNLARCFYQQGRDVAVVTPEMPGLDESQLPYSV